MEKVSLLLLAIMIALSLCIYCKFKVKEPLIISSVFIGFFFAANYIVDDVLYYVFAGIIDLALVGYLIAFCKKTLSTLTVNLAACCMLSLLSNTIGLVLWVIYASPNYYNAAMLVVYLLIMAAMCNGLRNTGNIKGSAGNYDFVGSIRPRFFARATNEGRK